MAEPDQTTEKIASQNPRRHRFSDLLKSDFFVARHEPTRDATPTLGHFQRTLIWIRTPDSLGC